MFTANQKPEEVFRGKGGKFSGVNVNRLHQKGSKMKPWWIFNGFGWFFYKCLTKVVGLFYFPRFCENFF